MKKSIGPESWWWILLLSHFPCLCLYEKEVGGLFQPPFSSKYMLLCSEASRTVFKNKIKNPQHINTWEEESHTAVMLDCKRSWLLDQVKGLYSQVSCSHSSQLDAFDEIRKQASLTATILPACDSPQLVFRGRLPSTLEVRTQPSGLHGYTRTGGMVQVCSFPALPLAQTSRMAKLG